MPTLILLLGLLAWLPGDDVAEARDHECAYCDELADHDPQQVAAEQGISWHGTWEGGVAESRRSGRPVLLHIGAPRCDEVPGVW